MTKILTALFCLNILFCSFSLAGGKEFPFGSGYHFPADSTGKRIPRIGIMLPLSGAAEDKARTETALEFYKGMVLANEICTALDSGLEYHLFDHRNQAGEIRNLAKNACLEGLDVLVGPMRQTLLPLLDSLAAEKRIPLMNILSHSQLNGISGKVLSQQASIQAIAQNSYSQMALQSAGTKAGIVYGTEKNDSLLADAYRKICLANGKQVVLFRKVGKYSAANLSKYLSEAGLDSSSQLFVPNNENLVRVQLLSAYGILQAKFPVMIYGKWLEASNAELDEYAGLPFFFVSPDLPNPAQARKKLWESNFIARWGNPPGWIAWKGFDLAMGLSAAWYRNNKEEFDFYSAPVPSPVFGACIFENGKAENHYVPVYRVEKTGIRQVWP